jgi:hypothetical protein
LRSSVAPVRAPKETVEVISKTRLSTSKAQAEMKEAAVGGERRS